jgi:hypothetical protein
LHGTKDLLVDCKLAHHQHNFSYNVTPTSSSVHDLDIVACFVAFHETKFGPKNIETPQVDLLSPRQHTESTSKKALSKLEGDF